MIRTVVAGGILAVTVSLVEAQQPPRVPGEDGSRNVQVLSHIPLGGRFLTGDIEVEQDLSRPYVYMSRIYTEPGFDIISVKDPKAAKRIYSWRIENPELHLGVGGSDGHYFKYRGRYYYVESVQFRQGGPDADLGALVFDVTGLPDTTKVKEVARIRYEVPVGFHTIFPYKHSDGRVLLFTAPNAAHSAVFDLGLILEGKPGLVGKVPGSEPTQTIYGLVNLGYHDFYVAYDPATHQDKFYGASIRGYNVYDVTKPEDPKLITTIQGAAGVEVAHTFQATPDGRYAVTQTEYQYSPVRFWDLKPGLDGTVKAITRPIGAWAANWKLASHNHEIRWPYVFIGAFEDGLQIVNMMDPTNPYTVGFYNTHSGSVLHGEDLGFPPKEGTSIFDGVWGVDVRNADGMIVASDFSTGFWSFHMDGFDGWNGHQWGMPNISSVQDWDNGPDGAPKPQKVS
jgi:hypothetical protein